MARKNLLTGLMGDQGAAKPAEKAPAPRYSKGAIGAVSKSIADLKSRSIVDVVADQIDPGGLRDRLEDDPQDHDALVASIRDYGQQVPVLLRQDPNHEGRYQVVYGRRRVSALKELGLPVKAMIRNLNDRDLVVAQGQENAARKDLTFIEKANFARQMRDGGFDRKVICDALHIDKTVISRMLSVADGIPEKVILGIGAAPSIGRDRWLGLASAIETDGKGEKSLMSILRDMDAKGSDARFEALLSALTKPAQKPATPSKADVLSGVGGRPLAQVHRKANAIQLTFRTGSTDGFDDWLIENIQEIHRSFLKERGE